LAHPRHRRAVAAVALPHHCGRSQPLMGPAAYAPNRTDLSDLFLRSRGWAAALSRLLRLPSGYGCLDRLLSARATWSAERRKLIEKHGAGAKLPEFHDIRSSKCGLRRAAERRRPDSRSKPFRLIFRVAVSQQDDLNHENRAKAESSNRWTERPP